MIESLVRKAIVEPDGTPTAYFLALFDRLVATVGTLVDEEELGAANVLFSDLDTTNIDAGVQTLTTSGYSALGVGAATYARTASTGATAYRTQSADGAWWQLAEPIPTLEQFGGSVSAALAYLQFVRQADGAAGVTMGTVTLGDGQRIVGADLTTTTTSSASWAIGFASAAERVLISEADLTGPASGPGAMVNLSTSNTKFLAVTRSRITAPGGYGILDNTGASGGDGAAYLFNMIASKGDAVCLNHPSVTVSRRHVVGNILDTSSSATSSAFGFAVSVANTDDVVIALNFVRSSRLEAIHIEDGQHRNIVLGNTGVDLSANGIHVLKASVGQGDADPVIAVANHMRSGSGTGTGFRAVYDANGTQTFCVVDANVMRDFACAYDQGGAQQAFGDNVAHTCATVLRAAKNSFSTGRHYVMGGATTLFSGEATSHGGSFFCTTLPTNLIVKANSNYPGPAMERARFPFSYAHTGGSTYQQFLVCTLPTLFAGRITIQTDDSSASSIFYTVVVTWNAQTPALSLVANSGAGIVQGDMSAPTLVMVGSDLYFNFFCVTARSGTAWADLGIPAVLYQHS